MISTKTFTRAGIFIVVTLACCLSSPVTAAKTVLEAKSCNTVDEWMDTGVGSNIPLDLRGIFFMDGNPMPEDVVTMSGEGTTWNPDTLTLEVQVLDSLRWTFRARTPLGRIYLAGLRLLDIRLFLEFKDETLREGIMKSELRGIPFPQFLIAYPFTQTGENGETWHRPSVFFGGLFSIDYTLRKIVDPYGNKMEPAFSKMTRAMRFRRCWVNTYNNGQ